MVLNGQIGRKIWPTGCEVASFQVVYVKEESDSWNDHILYLMVLCDAVGGAEDQILESIVKFASASRELQGVLQARLNTERENHLREGDELVLFAQLNNPVSQLGN